MRLPSRAQWLGARAANGLRRRGPLAVTFLIAFGVTLATYLLVPPGAEGVQRYVLPRVPPPDTVQLLGLERAAARQLAVAESVLESRTLSFSTAEAASVDRAIEQSARRDSIRDVVAELGGLLQRAASAPLLESYRAVAASPLMAADPVVRVLLDSLALLDSDRSASGRGAVADPLFMALTSRLTAVGQEIGSRAEKRLLVLRDSLSAMGAVQSGRADEQVGDEDAEKARSDLNAAQRALEDARARLAGARVEASSRAGGKGASSDLIAPLSLRAVAAGVVALFIALALAFASEMRDPRVADAAEAQNVTDLRVLANPRPRRIPPDRFRRAADRALPYLLDPTADEYRMLAWHVSSQWPRDGIVTVACHVPEVAGVVGSNLAAVLANDARATLLVDTVFDREPVRRILGLAQVPGLAEVLDNKRRWSESLVLVAVGRSRTLDVLPAGARGRPLGATESDALISELSRAARRHDATVVVATTEGACQGRAGDDVIVCAVRGLTRISSLRRDVITLVRGGARVRGVVLWSHRVPAPSEARSGSWAGRPEP